MYETGQNVLYGSHGICRIMGIEAMSVGGTKAQYYVLEPFAQPGARFYVPMANDAALSKLRPLLTQQELLDLLHSNTVLDFQWISDANQRKIRFREVIVSGDRSQLMGMIGALYRHKKSLNEAGRKFHQSDENFLKEAENLLNAEFALVFGLTPKEVPAFIRRELENTH